MLSLVENYHRLVASVPLMNSAPRPTALSPSARTAVLVASFLGLLFDGFELGLMPIASLSVSRSLLGSSFNATAGGDWFASFTASLMLGAALGGILLGNLGDCIGRTRAMGVSILFYSIFAALGAYVQTQQQMLILRFLVGLGVGGMWPNGIALVSECWPTAGKPLVSGVMMAGLNAGILLLSQLARTWPITPDSWRWIFQLSGAPALLGLAILLFLPESPEWLASRSGRKRTSAPFTQLFAPDLRRTTMAAIIISVIPMLGAWSASKWMIPWADKVAGAANAEYKAATQGWWALGAMLGAIAGAELASRLGRRRSYLAISIGATTLTVSMFTLTAPLVPGFHAIVFAQGLVSTLFFGWLALYLPEIFPVHVRATGSGLAYNFGRFGTAVGVLGAGALFTALGGDYPRVGAICAMVYSLGIFAIWLVNESATE